ncbi:hypothetical protein Q8A67_009703 [Cirrhinus molitorella]|uniref:Uncharacterized protein n=1 Tax=Cirrhinus molitorella TaxID=172907 RepID=A0AA88PY60_9TELE|nr:hypothetical protein Q8A67_009703 [Cirrhinus molitorella]
MIRVDSIGALPFSDKSSTAHNPYGQTASLHILGLSSTTRPCSEDAVGVLRDRSYATASALFARNLCNLSLKAVRRWRPLGLDDLRVTVETLD